MFYLILNIIFEPHLFCKSLLIDKTTKMNNLKFKELLENGESDIVDFKECHYLTKSNLGDKKKIASFIKDIICMANTVRTTNAYIIIGVKELDGGGIDLVGVTPDEHLDDAIYSAKFDSKVSPTPKYLYYKHKYKNKYFSIFEIPLVPYTDIVQPIRHMEGLEPKNVYLRRQSTNSRAEPSEIKYIYEWLAQLDKSGDKFGSYKSRSNRKLYNDLSTKKEVKQFDDKTIYRLFGNEAAEDEDIERLKTYYFKSDIFSQITEDLPVRILVAHKGVGKSALFKVAQYEDGENDRLSIMIKPNEVSKYGRNSNDFIELINDWKKGLYSLIVKKTARKFGLHKQEYFNDNNIDIYENIIEYIEFAVYNEINSGKIHNLVIANRFLEERKINVYIDDLDRGWAGTRNDITRLSALLNAVRDLCNENRGLQMKIAMRSDVYYLVRTSDESTDKIQSSVVWYNWSNHQILVMLIKRIETFFDREVKEAALMLQDQKHIALMYLENVIETRYKGRGRWSNVPMHRVLMSLVRQRPRDLVKLLTMAAREAFKSKSTIIKSDHLQSIFEVYSQERIQDAVNEFRTELPEIKRLLFGMRPTRKAYDEGNGFQYSTSSLVKKIHDIMEMGKFRFADGQEASAKELAQFLYKINFLTAKKTLEDGYIDRKYFEQNRYLSSEVADFGYDWEIHMAYRWALQPTSMDDIFAELNS